MKIKMTKSIRVSLDGINVIQVKKGEVISNPTPRMLDGFKNSFTLVEEKPTTPKL